MTQRFTQLDNDIDASSSSKRKRVSRATFYEAILFFAVVMLTILVVYALTNDVTHFNSINTMMKMLNASLCCNHSHAINVL